MRGPPRRAAARGVRVPRGARAPPPRRRPTRGLGDAARRAAPAAHPAGAVDVGGGAGARPRVGPVADGAQGGARERAAVAPRAGDAVPVPHLLRRDALAGDDRRGGVDVRRPRRARRARGRRDGRRARGAAGVRGDEARRARGRRLAGDGASTARGSTRCGSTWRARRTSPTRSTSCSSTTARRW